MIFNLMDNMPQVKGLQFTYSGNMEDPKTITVSGTKYTLYTFTGSGTLKVKGKGIADIWACGGGAQGASTITDQTGGGGGYFAQILGQNFKNGSYTITIGAAQGTTSLAKNNETILTAKGATDKNGASGGGGFCDVYEGPMSYSNYADPGTGGKVSTRPFNDSTNFINLPCAGGGGAGDYSDYDSTDGCFRASSGGAGGTNGGGGFTASESGTSGGAGGNFGGGHGKLGTSDTGLTSATYYGSGGGGGKIYNSSTKSYVYGYGYQGVMYIRVPITQ